MRLIPELFDRTPPKLYIRNIPFLSPSGASNTLSRIGRYLLASLIFHQRLAEFDLAGNVLSEEALDQLLKILALMPVGSLSLSDCGIHRIQEPAPGYERKGLQKLSNFLASPHCTLQYLDLTHNELGAEEAQLLAEGLRRNKTLLGLNLGHNPIGDSGFNYLSSVIENHPTLCHVRLARTDLTAETAQKIWALKSHPEKMQRFVMLDDNPFMQAAWSPLEREGLILATQCHERKSFKTLTESMSIDMLPLSLELTQAIQHRTQLTSLDFSYEPLNLAAVIYLAETIGFYTSLEELDLTKTDIDADGLQIILESVVKAELPLKKIILGKNYLSKASMTVLSEILKKIPTLTAIALPRTMLDAEKIRILSRGLGHCQQLIYLNIKHNELTMENIQILLESVKLTSTLPLRLDIQGNLVENADVFLLQYLKSYPRQMVFDLQVAQQMQLFLEKQQTDQTVAEEIVVLKSNVKRGQFYAGIQNYFSEFIIAYKVLHSGKVAHQADKVDQLAGLANLVGGLVPLPGAAGVTAGLGVVLGLAHAQQQAGHSACGGALAPTLSQAEVIVEAVARALTFRYEAQLQNLTEKGINKLAKCAVNKMINFLKWDQLNAQEDVVIQLLQVVSRRLPQKQRMKDWIKEGAIYSPHFFTSLSSKVKGFAGHLLTEAGCDWDNFYHVLEKPGIRTSVGIYYNDDHLGSGRQLRPEKYGYRLGAEQEADELGLCLMQSPLQPVHYRHFK